LSRNDGRPLFVFIHTYQIHDPYVPPPPYNKIFDPDYDGWIIGDYSELTREAKTRNYISLHRVFWGIGQRKKADAGGDFPLEHKHFGERDIFHLNALYDGEILYTDSVLEIFLARLAANKLLDNSILIITSDHGEEFMEHGDFLHRKLYRETIEVPLIIFFPGRVPAGKVVKTQVRLIDLAPTILELAGIAVPGQIQGKSLAPLIMGEEGAEDRPAYSENPWNRRTHHRSLRDAGFTLYDKESEGVELYDRAADHAEQKNISRERPDDMDKMNVRLEHFMDSEEYNPRPTAPVTQRPVPISPERLKELRALGYVE